jgi:hypothetical protein
MEHILKVTKIMYMVQKPKNAKYELITKNN